MLTLTANERTVLLLACRDHAVASCPSCRRAYRFSDLGSDFLGHRHWSLCPRCLKDLTASLRAHLRECPAAGQREATEYIGQEVLDPIEERLLELLARRRDDRFCSSCAAILLFASHEDVAHAITRLRVVGVVHVDVGVCTTCSENRTTTGIERATG